MLLGDKVMLTDPGDPDGPCYEGYVHEVGLLHEPGHEKTCLMSYANKKGPDQPAYRHSLISAFVVRCLDSIISLDSIADILRH